MWNRIREEYQPLIAERSASIDRLLESYAKTGDEYMLKLAQDQIKAQREIKEHIIKLEKKAGLYDS